MYEPLAVLFIHLQILLLKLYVAHCSNNTITSVLVETEIFWLVNNFSLTLHELAFIVLAISHSDW